MRKTICVDFDGTIAKHEFPDIGPPIKEMADFLRGLDRKKYEIIIHTCRSNEDCRYVKGRDMVKEMDGFNEVFKK